MARDRKKWLWFALKLGLSAGIIYLIFHKILQREQTLSWSRQLAGLSYPLLTLCALSFGVAIAANVLRWNRLLEGQGIHAPRSYLATTFMIARFFGAAGGLIGLSGFRLYDVARRTGKTARAAASIGIELVIGNMAMGCVALLSCLFGLRYVGSTGVLMLSLLFGSLIAVTFTILARPRFVRVFAQRLPKAAAARLQTAVDAVCAYDGKSGLLAQAVGYGIVIHVCNNMVYVFAAEALGVSLPLSELFFVSTLQNIVSHLPITPNGVGLREMTAVGLYTAVGLPPEQALLIPIVGFSVDMAISALGGVLLLLRKADYAPAIVVDDAEREEVIHARIERAQPEQWPRLLRGTALGASAGAIAGLCIGLGEAGAVVGASRGQAEPDVWFFGVLSYALLCAGCGALLGAASALSGRLMQRRAAPEASAFAHFAAAIAASFGLVIGVFRVQRDVFHEELAWKSAQGALVIAGALLGAGALYVLFALGLSVLARTRFGRLLLRPEAAGALVAGCALLALLGAKLATAPARVAAARPAAAPQAGNVLFVVVDTLRADHLPLYGYRAGSTPQLDAFARDAVRFEQAYANASWTRPSFATLLTGRYPSSHGVMSKAASLPDALTTLPEAFGQGGYATCGIVTNFNVAPFFNFAQGFDEYHYLAPNFLFGASDSAAKLSLLQIMRRVDELGRAALGRSEPGSAYQDASVVNREIEHFFDTRPAGGRPWLLFVGYMDPHDPYYEHPYNGVGYSRAAHVSPQAGEADRLRRLYDGEISFWDQHFGALIQDLKRRGLYDALTIVVTADHGEEFMDHGGFWHGTTLYDEQLHVPLLVKLPRAERAGTLVAHWVESVDIMPTLLGLSRLPLPEGMQGIDLFRGKEQTFAEESHEGNVLTSLRMREQGAALKLISANPGNPRGLKPKELYRLDVDPAEQRDLSEREQAALANGERELEAAQKQAQSGALKAREVDLAMDKSAEERLKALGYAHEQ